MIIQSFACFIYLLTLHFNFHHWLSGKIFTNVKSSILSPRIFCPLKIKIRIFLGKWCFPSINSTKFANFFGKKIPKKCGNIIKLKNKTLVKRWKTETLWALFFVLKLNFFLKYFVCVYFCTPACTAPAALCSHTSISPHYAWQM